MFTRKNKLLLGKKLLGTRNKNYSELGNNFLLITNSVLLIQILYFSKKMVFKNTNLYLRQVFKFVLSGQ